MLDYQRIVDDVRSLLCVQGADAMDFLRAAAADYSVACDEVNERLHQCGSLLRQGLRSEAIQVAEIEPNLLDVAALLDFPERPQWVEASVRYGIAAPTPLLLDVAAQLNEAYALEQPLVALLQRHRLLALAREQLPARIDVLRRLAALDVNNPVWQEDLQTFEQERHKQLLAEVEAAARAGDMSALASLHTELSDPEWQNPPPAELANSAEEAHTRLRYWAIQSQLEGLATELESAMTNCRLDLGKTLYTRWSEVANSGWQPNRQLAERVATALKWIQEHLEREAAVKALADTVDDERSADRLRELHRAVLKFGKLSAKLNERYLSRLALLERAARRLLCLKLGAAAAGGLVVMLIIGWIVSYERYEQKVAAATKNLPFLIERGDIERAESLARELPPRVKNDPRLQKLLILLEDKRKSDEGRQKKFSRRFDTALYLLGKLQPLLATDPGQSVLDGLRGELELFQTELDQAKNLMRKDEERTKVASLGELAANVKDEWQRQLDRAFLTRHGDLEERLKKIERDTHSSIRELETKTTDFKGELRKWETISRHVSPAYISRINTLDERVTSCEKRNQKLVQEERDKELITAAVGDIQGFLSALQEYNRNNPDSDRTPDLERAAEESLCWQAVAEWNKLAGQINGGGIVRLGPAAAQESATLAAAVSDNFGDCPECVGVGELLPYLKAIAQRDNGGERIDTPLKKLFTAPLVKDVWMIEKEGAKQVWNMNGVHRYHVRYYVQQQPNAGRPFLYIIGFDGKTVGGVLSPEEWKRAKVALAPQVAVAEKLLPVLEALNDENWEPSFYKMIQAIHANDSMDPILKANLLQQVLEAGVRGSHCLKTAFQRHLKWFNQQRINSFANWLDPADVTVGIARSEAARKLSDFPDIVLPGRAAAEELKTLRQRRLPEYRWVGWLHRARDGRWECLMQQAPGRAGQLLTVYRNAFGEKPRFGVVGRFSGTIATVDTTAPLVAGRPVFLHVP